MIRALILIHRWLGIAFCLLFAMWFASGMVMHFVPFPALEETERVTGLATVGPQAMAISPGDALKALDAHTVRRLRLNAVGTTLVYVALRNDNTLAALDASSGKPLVVTQALALASARVHAQARGLDATRTRIADLEHHDQWTVPNGFDAHRPLYRIALDDTADTMLYVSSVTGQVVLDTHRTERAWNWAGSVVHWIYPTVLRKHWAAWDSTVWWLSLVAMTGALAGMALGVISLKASRSPFQGWMKWHHLLGLGCVLFVLTWIFSGWLSMDHGRLFSRGMVSSDERMRIEGRALSVPPVSDMPALGGISLPMREIEWFPFAGQNMMRVISGDGKREIHTGAQRNTTITSEQVVVAAHTLGAACETEMIGNHDAYPARSSASSAPVYRVICGEIWFHIDGADGRVLEKLDASRRAYRWAYQALHTFDVPALRAQPALRTLLIVVLCAAGFAFSVTGVVIGWRRLKRTVS